MIGLLLPKRQYQNPSIPRKSIVESPLYFGLAEILIKTGSKSQMGAKTNDSRVAQSTIFVPFIRIGVLEDHPAIL